MASLRLTAGTERFEFELLEGAPRTAEWLTAQLPYHGELRQSIWSGQSCVTPISAEAPALESPMTSLYPGQLAVTPDTTEEGLAGAGLFVGYGAAELRGSQGRLYGTPVARLVGPIARLSAVLELARTKGVVAMTLTMEG